jgi:hypothetical protein
MKKYLITIALAAGIFFAAGEKGPTHPVYCDCVGIGMPKTTNVQTAVDKPKSAQTIKPGQNTFYQIVMAWLWMHGLL